MTFYAGCKQIRALELYYPMIQFLIIEKLIYLPEPVLTEKVRRF